MIEGQRVKDDRVTEERVKERVKERQEEERVKRSSDGSSNE